jgi:hypothetical protein
MLSLVSTTIPDLYYFACFTEEDGIYSCGHQHPTVREAMNCMTPDGGSFVRAWDRGLSRSLNDREFIDFMEALQTMTGGPPRKM